MSILKRISIKFVLISHMNISTFFTASSGNLIKTTISSLLKMNSASNSREKKYLYLRYSGHALSKKAVDRIFDLVPRKFKCKVPGKMSYDDFICKPLFQ